jgi:predicted GNAT family N-acyltransferase
MITYRQITTSDREYEAEKALRNRALRTPLGLTLSETDLRGEDRQIHLLAIDENGEVVGCVLIVPLAEGTARIRQMAVEERLRGQGIGAGLMAQAEALARALPARKVTMHARLYARGFYERLGYKTASEIFTEKTIPHILMEKTLEPENPYPGPSLTDDGKNQKQKQGNPA